MSETTITVVGNVGQDPQRRVLASGAVVTDFRVASTPRRLDKASGEWRDLPTTWFTVTCWRALADNVATSVRRGDRVVVTGRLQTKAWETREVEPRSGLEIDASAVGHDLSRAPVTVERPERKVERHSGEGGTAGSAAAQPTDEWTSPLVDPLPAEEPVAA